MSAADLEGTEATGYANIALIKYMGKRDPQRNEACNPSLSYTLPHLRTTVVIGPSAESSDRWRPLQREGNEATRLTAQARDRFLRYARDLCDAWGYRRPIVIQSASNFPADAGIASSASSFSALTKALASFLRRRETTEELARLSRAASGSSCRSFFAPWCVWDGDRIVALDFPLAPLLHMVVIVDARRKGVSSSDAHRRVLTSPEFAGRPDRARARMEALTHALERCDWPAARAISSAEYIDMHTLFHTSDPPFRYHTSDSERVVHDCEELWRSHGDGPIVTMDAGPNVHLLFREDQRAMASRTRERFARSYRIVASDLDAA